jgi:hypothetical protein
MARKVAWAKTALAIATDEAWQLLMGPEGILAEGTLEGLQPGQPYSLRTARGQVFRGIVKTLSPPYEFSGTVENLGDSLLRIAVEHSTAEPLALIWLATYGLSQVKLDEMQKAFHELLGRLFSESG